MVLRYRTPSFLAAALAFAFVPLLASAAPGAPQALLLDPDPPIIESFNRPDENPLSDGGAWSVLAANYPLKVISNQLACAVAGLTCDAWRTAVRYGLDQDVMVTITAEPANGQWARLYVRLQKPSVFDGYAVRFVNQSPPSANRPLTPPRCSTTSTARTRIP